MTDSADSLLHQARALLPGEELADAETIKSGERSTVVRVRATGADRSERTIIVKRYHDRGEGWLRETAALASIPGSVRAPAIVAVADALLVTEDLGDGGTVADALLGDDPAAAEAAVLAWVEALAELHVATRDARQAFAEVLAERARTIETDHEPSESWMPTRLRDAERVLDRLCGALGVRIPDGAMAELIGLTDRLGPEETAALTPADTCPDNNVWLGDRLVLLDFEGAQWRHVAWDVAYLDVPWPGCRHAWRLPDDVVARAIERYRGSAVAGLPAVADPSFLADVEAAVAGWALLTAAWSLDYALGADLELDQRLDLDERVPTRRATTLHRLRRAAATRAVPALAELAGALAEELTHRWGDVELELAPAFRA